MTKIHVFMKIKTSWTRLFRYTLSAAIPLALIPLANVGTKEARCAYVMLLVISYWILQPIPLPVTSLFPVVFYPLFGIMSTADVCAPYASSFVIFIFAGLILSVAMEHSHLHQRLALKLLLAIGTSNVRLLAGFIFCTGFLSMWFTNLACAAMMMPIAEGVIAEKRLQKRKFESEDATPMMMMKLDASTNVPTDLTNGKIEEYESEQSQTELDSLRKGFLLGIAYASSIGGTGTLIGAGSNIVLVGVINEMFPTSSEINFGSWLLYAVPGMAAVLFTCGVVLYVTNLRKCPKYDGTTNDVKLYLQKKYQELGPVSFHQGAVITVIAVFILVLFTREPKIFQGWGSAFPDVQLKDATPAFAITLLLFIIPSQPLRPLSSPPLLEWKTVQEKLPWGILFIMGGGFALANGFQKSGLSHWVQGHLAHLDFLAPEIVLIVLLIITTGTTELTSNTSTATSFLPIVADLASVMKVNPLYFLVPVAVTCSYAFMFPVATPSNALVFDTAKMNVRDMALPGFVMNVVSCFISFVLINTLGVLVFDTGNLPGWAVSHLPDSNTSSSAHSIYGQISNTTSF